MGTIILYWCQKVNEKNSVDWEKGKRKGRFFMIRKIIRIDEEKCNGCGACAAACHEGAIEMVEGKARLTREDYCDGLGDCLPACPTDAIAFEEREAPAYNEAAVLAAKREKAPLPCGCPGTQAKAIRREPGEAPAAAVAGQLSQWPVQIKLLPVNAPYFDGAKLLIAADCTAYAYGNFHNEFIRGHITLIGCPKLDQGDYTEKLTQIIANNRIKSVTVVRMEVPCCGGIEAAAKQALQASGKFIPWNVVTISTDGRILER
jgi:ferredoxin